MKRVISSMLTAALLAAPVISATAERDVISVTVDNEEVVFDQTPIIDEGRTLVPVRAVFEKAGAAVAWDQDSQTASIVKDDHVVQITLYDTVLYKNGEAVPLDVPAKMVNDRILIPVRAIGEAMDFAISWDGYHSQVVISTNGQVLRPYAGRSKAFKQFSDAAIFYREGTFAWENVDVDGDGELDTVSFTATNNVEGETKPLLLINGENVSSALLNMANTYSFAVVDVSDSDNKREIIVSSNEDTRAAYFYRYENKSLVPVTIKEKPSVIRYLNQLFFDGKTYILSDLEGITWTDIMVTSSAYQIKDNVMKSYFVTSTEPMLPRILVNTYGDDMLYNVYTTESFSGGSYKDKAPERFIHSYELSRFVLEQMYIDEYTPQYGEYFIRAEDGSHMVITPFVQ